MTGGVWTRRHLVAAALGAATLPVAAATPAPRLVALDWGWASTLIGLGLMPAGVAEQRLYADWVGTPAIPAGVPDVGLRTSPSLETLAALKPDLILTNALNAGLRSRLETIAPTFDNPTFTSAMTPLANAREATLRLAERVARGDEAKALITATSERMARAGARVREHADRPLIPVQMVDGRHVTIYGRGSLFADVLAAMGLRHGYAGPTSIWGFVTRGVADLAELPPADLLLVAPFPAEIDRLIAGQGLMASLLRINGSRVYRLPQAWTYGDLTAAARFADLVADALTQGAPA